MLGVAPPLLSKSTSLTVSGFEFDEGHVCPVRWKLLIINGFCKDVFRELPMEFAVEAQRLLGMKLEGSVG